MKRSNSITRSGSGLAAAAAAAIVGLAPGLAAAVCADGSTLPAGGYVVGSPQLPTASNWSPGIFTGTAGSIFVPDTSVNEHNNPAEPLTNGGHDWVFDQGSTLCKEFFTGPANAQPTGWAIPPNTPTDCVVLPVIKGGVVQNLGDIPYQGETVTPTCNPALLGTTANTYFNQLGCSISHGAATDAAHATTYLFVAGIKGGLFSIPLNNVRTPVVGGTAGKTVGPQNYYSAIPEGQKLTNAAVSPDGQFAMVTSIRRAQYVYACLNPLGDPGQRDPVTGLFPPINPNFFVPPASTVKCMQIGNNNLAVDLTTAFGPDNQPYFGGQRIVNSFDSVPGSSALNPVPTAWPNCIWQNNGSLSLADAFAHNRTNGCGNAQPNFGFGSALVTQPQALISHVAPNGDMYMYTGPLGGTIVQFKLTVDPISGFTNYAFRTYLTGISLNTGLGTEDGLKSLMVFSDPSALGLAGQEVITKLPLCEDM